MTRFSDSMVKRRGKGKNTSNQMDFCSRYDSFGLGSSCIYERSNGIVGCNNKC